MHFPHVIRAAALCSLIAVIPAQAQSTSGQTSTPAATAGAAAPDYTPTIGQPGKDVMWVPTSQTLVDRMLEMTGLTPADHLVDLGSGDGRLVITAAKRGATAHGIEYNPNLVEFAKRAAIAEGVANRATFEKADIFESDFSKATVVTLFLLPELNLQLRPILLKMKPGTRVVSNSFPMGDWTPDETAFVKDQCSAYCEAYKWIVPAQVAGVWSMGDRKLILAQRYQKFSGELHHGDSMTPIREAKLEGTRISFRVGTQRFVGQVNGNTIHGTANGQPWHATLTSR